jgi:hypothetical protein
VAAVSQEVECPAVECPAVECPAEECLAVACLVEECPAAVSPEISLEIHPVAPRVNRAAQAAASLSKI